MGSEVPGGSSESVLDDLDIHALSNALGTEVLEKLLPSGSESSGFGSKTASESLTDVKLTLEERLDLLQMLNARLAELGTQGVGGMPGQMENEINSAARPSLSQELEALQGEVSVFLNQGG